MILQKSCNLVSHHRKRDITIPLPKVSRMTMFFDESGGAKMPQQKIPVYDENRYFIFTAIIANNYDIEKFQEYYFQLKYKYLRRNCEFHSSSFFVHEKKENINFIKNLSVFIDTIPFIFLTVIVDKRKVFENSSIITPYQPMETSFKKALSISIDQGLSGSDFYSLSIKDALRNISKYSFHNISNYYPLKIAYKTLLETYFNKVYPALFKNVFSNYKDIKPLVNLCLETSPNKERILKYTDQLRNKMDGEERENLANNIYNSVYNVSFPFKKARYLGLELADLIGYGYSLEKRKRLSKVPMYRPIRKMILKRVDIVKQQLGIEPVIEVYK